MATALRPSLAAITERIQADADARCAELHLRRSDYDVAVRVIAGASHELYSAIEFGRRQLFTETAETSYLERRGRLFNIERKAATYAVGVVQFAWEAVTDIPTGTLVQTSGGLQYQTTGSPDSSGYAPVQSVEAGAAYNLTAGEELTLVSSIAGVTGATVTTAIAGGTDAETDDSLRARILARTQNPPRTGTAEDYVAWALEVPGVTRAWCHPRESGPGTVTVRIMADDTTGFPDAALLAAVQEYLESKADVLADIYVVSPIAQPVDFTLQITPDNVTQRARAEAALQALFDAEAVPGGGIYLSHVHAALSAVVDEIDHVIVSPVADPAASGSSYMLTLGTITWQS